MKKQYFYIVCMAVAAAALAASGNIPYGYRFGSTLFPYIKIYYVILGVIFAFTATLANTALGTYSLLNTYKEKNYQKKALTLSVVGAMPMGFVCFFGYRNLIPLPLDLVISCTVTLVNGAVGYVAIISVLDKMKYLNKWRLWLATAPGETITKAIGFCLGFCMSLVGYVASGHGIQLIFHHFGWSSSWAVGLAYVIALLTWLPFAALYANSIQTVFGELYQQTANIKKAKHNPQHHTPFSWLQVSIIVFSLLSSAALTQITLELFSPTNDIPELFKQAGVQMFIHYFLVPITLISGAVNYVALTKLLQRNR